MHHMELRLGRHSGPEVEQDASWFVALSFGAALVSLMVLCHRMMIIDDAFISFRYAANLVRSGQLVFNLGERVEGATNLLWILMLAGLRRATGLPIQDLAATADLALFGYAAARCQMLLRWIGLGPVESCFVVAATLGLGDVFLAMTNGLEAALYAALLSEALVALVRRRPVTLGILIGLLFMARPEGAVVGTILVASFSLHRHVAGALGRAVLLGGSLIGATTIWRFAYFGALVPNSIVAKSFPLAQLPSVLRTMSLPYLESFVFGDPTLALTLVAGSGLAFRALWLRAVDPCLSGLWFAVTAIPLASLAIAARNGGDWMPHFRLLTQYAPCYSIALGLTAYSLTASSPLALTAVTALALWPAIQGATTGFWCRTDIRTKPAVSMSLEAAARLAPILKDSDVVSAEAAGLLPYLLLSTRVHDPIGLMDTYIARHGMPSIPYGKTDIPYTFEKVRPTFMVWHWAGHVFQASPSARARYAAFCWARCDQHDDAAVVLVRRDRLDAAVSDAFQSWTPWPLNSTSTSVLTK